MTRKRNPGGSYYLPDYCELISLSRPTVMKLIAQGKLTAYKIGRRTYISERAHREFIDRMESEAQPNDFV